MKCERREPASSAAARMTSDDQSILHLMNPIARLGDFRIVRHQQQSFPFFLHNSLQQLEGAPGVCAVEISGGFIGENHARDCWRARAPRPRVVVLRRRDGGSAASVYSPSPTSSSKWADRSCISGSLKRGQSPHRDHHVFLRGKIFEEKMKLEDESEELIPSSAPGRHRPGAKRPHFRS